VSPRSQPATRVTVEFPKYVIDMMQAEADRSGVTVEELAKIWIAEHIDQLPEIRELNRSAMDPRAYESDASPATSHRPAEHQMPPAPTPASRKRRTRP